MSEVEDAPWVVQLPRNPLQRKTVAWIIAVVTAVVALTVFSPGNRAARAAALTDETRAAFIKSTEEGCFEGQSRQEANKSRQPEQLRALCHCLAEKLSYTMTMEKTLALVGQPFSPTAEEQRLMRAVFDNCWQVNVK